MAFRPTRFPRATTEFDATVCNGFPVKVLVTFCHAVNADPDVDDPDVDDLDVDTIELFNPKGKPADWLKPTKADLANLREKAFESYAADCEDEGETEERHHRFREE